MTITLNLEAEEVAVLTARADAQGVNIETVLHRLVAQLVRTQEQERTLKQQKALILLDSWTLEKERMIPDEMAAHDAEFEEFKSNINRWRVEEGRGPAFRGDGNAAVNTVRTAHE